MRDSDPYLGAIVHYRRLRAAQPKCFAAIVTDTSKVQVGLVGLSVFAPPWHDTPAIQSVSAAEHNGETENTWHWPHECNG